VSGDDPEKLLSEALRAQATRAPSDAGPVGFGLYGSDFPPPARPTDTTRRIAVPPPPPPRPRQVSAALILLLALLLGLAAGAVVGLLTLI
jgi:hypothetical protein